MKDPLQKQQTPYEVLGVSRGATAADIDSAFKTGLVNRINVQKLTVAKTALDRPVSRAIIDLLHYDDEALARLDPDPRSDAAVLEIEKRSATAVAWEAQLRRSFPDLKAIHSLAVLYYWWASSESETLEQSAATPPDVAELWRNVVAYWPALIANRDFWSVQSFVSSDIVDGVIDALTERIAADIHRCAQARGESAKALQKLELLLANEIRTARALASANIVGASGKPLPCGPLLLARLEILDQTRREVTTALANRPNDSTLVALRDALSPFSEIAALAENKQYELAHEELKALPLAERDSEEARKLEVHVLLEWGKQLASVKDVYGALQRWVWALNHANTDEAKARIEEEVIRTIQADAAASQEHDLFHAIFLLEQTLKYFPAKQLELTLAEMLLSRGMAAVVDAQKEREGDEAEFGDDSPFALEFFVKNLEKALKDLEQAAELGSQRAAERAGEVREVMAASLVTWASHEAEDKHWDTAVSLLRSALGYASRGSEMSRKIENQIGSLLANRAIEKINYVTDDLEYRLRNDPDYVDKIEKEMTAARRELDEAALLAPANEHVQSSLREVKAMQDGPLGKLVREKQRQRRPWDFAPPRPEFRNWAHALVLGLAWVIAALSMGEIHWLQWLGWLMILAVIFAFKEFVSLIRMPWREKNAMGKTFETLLYAVCLARLIAYVVVTMRR